ncbi:S1C family serine protease [Phenylobacterium sp.]|uniref:S1C family serine protease n=1 Tax=Phenylobacterium sp. TaxID=1871053 RepID=UPI002CC7AABE|nr:trypsin-like peptidase domain-containing protein [Phenylobacterium sp.]HVI32422.1 trypsin-like peptidase domain-containing protein [Phenylobacterium sp.]
MKTKLIFAAVLSLAMAGAAQAQAPSEARPATSVSQPISFTRIAFRLPMGTPWARLQYADFPMPCREIEVMTWQPTSDRIVPQEDLERIFREEIGRSGFQVSGDPSNLFEQDRKDSDLQVGALVTGIDATFCGKTPLTLATTERIIMSGSARMTIEWQVYSTVQARLLARVPTVGAYTTKTALDAGNIVILQRAFADSVRQLAASDAFRQAASGPAAHAAPAQGAGTELVIRTAGPAAAGRPISDAAGSVATLFAGSSMGSGFLISPDGYLLTNQHVVGDASRVRVRWADGREEPGDVLRTDRRRDVALVKVGGAGARQPLVLRTALARPGETTFAVGTPLDKTLENTVTRGVVSAQRTIDGQAFIQSDVGVTRGNSGGPLLDERGAVIGLTVMGLYPEESKSLNLFIPIADALRALAVKPAR